MIPRHFIMIALGSALLVAACGGSRSNDGSLEPDSLEILLTDWRHWAEGSDQGLWENDSSRIIHLSRLLTIGGEVSNPPFYSIESISISGDTIYVTDQLSEQLVALRSSDGSVFWRTGRPGEGPGCFSTIGQVDSRGAVIAVTNQALSRIDIFSREGIWLNSIPFMQPYDLCFVDDSILAVVSLANPDELVTLVSIDGSIIAAFGEWDHSTASLPPSNRNLHCAMVAPGILAVTSYYANCIQLMDLETHSLAVSFSRNLPIDIPEPVISGDGGVTTFALQTFILDVTGGPSGTVDVLLRPFAEDRTMGGAGSELAGVSIVDRFDLEGNYLDSFAIPGDISTIACSAQHLYAADWQKSSLDVFSCREGPIVE